VDLKYEEFFLSAWAVGDPAMVVDVPANANFQSVSNPEKGVKLQKHGSFVPNRMEPDTAKKLLFEGQELINKGAAASDPSTRAKLLFEGQELIKLGAKPTATKAFYPDDPSNVYHSYMNEHVKFRILHAGTGPSHVHHLHAHQWLHSPNSDNSQYLDSQMILPGSTYTLEIAYGGSGNRNKTVGDSIFHCHFYPHFAQGMWALWRVHDVFEEGTQLDPKTGIPLHGEPIW